MKLYMFAYSVFCRFLVFPALGFTATLALFCACGLCRACDAIFGMYESFNDQVLIRLIDI